jgi:N6-adenosine-specific RNA methylase IME4
VIYADPPWRWETWSREAGLDRAPEAHYDTMTVAEVAALNVRAIAADDAIVFLWTTAPLILEMPAVLDAWGFTYKTNLAWVKGRPATGYWLRGKHEHLLIATRGAIPAPLPGTQGESTIEALAEETDVEAPATGHSVKPVAAAEMIERWYPDVPKIELFCRGPARPGWDPPWGNEAEPAIEAMAAE